jgi:hypothetical protein
LRAIKELAEEHHIPFTSIEDLCQNEKINKLLLNDIHKIGKAANKQPYEIPKVILLDSTPFTPEKYYIME